MVATGTTSASSFRADSDSELETRRWGERCGRAIEGPLALFLIGDLGSGKTVFVQGLAAGLEVPDGYYVTSPSFTLINEYPGRLPLFHIDLYRLESKLDPDELGLTEALKADAVAAIEWADKLPASARCDGLEVRFETGEGDSRRLHFFGYGHDASSLIEELTLFMDGHRPTQDQD